MDVVVSCRACRREGYHLSTDGGRRAEGSIRLGRRFAGWKRLVSCGLWTADRGGYRGQNILAKAVDVDAETVDVSVRANGSGRSHDVFGFWEDRW